MTKVIVLGATGMIGRAVISAFANANVDLVATSRDGQFESDSFKGPVIRLDALADNLDDLDSIVTSGDWLINCIGIIKPHIMDTNAQQRRVAIIVNGLFPDSISRLAENKGLRVIQTATDCVFSGRNGQYSEEDEFDALDVYGKTKNLGEIPSKAMMHLRVSMVGPEFGRSTSLFEWVRNQPADAEIFGFTDHFWNGITTFHFGRLCRGIVENNAFSSGVTHVIPGSTVTKENLVRLLASRAGRSDIRVTPMATGRVIDRTLCTIKSELVEQLWKNAGYDSPPTIESMISEMPLEC